MIAVGYNGGADSAAALEWAATEARRRQTQLRIVHALNLPAVLTGPAGDAGAVPDEVMDSAERMTAEAEKRATDSGATDVTSEVRLGSPAGVLVEESKDVDLLAVGSRGRGELVSALRGSVALAVSAHAACPVVIVRGDGQRPIGADHPVVVGVDGSKQAAKAVTFAATQAERAGCELRLVGAWHLPTADGYTAEYWAWANAEEMRIASREASVQALEEARSELHSTHPDLTVITRVLLGDPATVLRENSRDAGLVVVGSRGREGFTGLLLGSVSHRVIHEASGPVAVVR